MRAGVRDQSVDQRDGRAVEAALVDERALGVLRDEHLAGETGGGGVGRRGVAGVAGRRQRDRLRAQILGARDRGRLSPRLERVGRVERFVLDVEPIEAEGRAERARVEQRREPFAEGDRRLAVEQRQQLAVAPHVRLASRQAVARPGTRPVEIVAGQQGSAATAQVMDRPGVESRCAARNGAFEMGEQGHMKV